MLLKSKQYYIAQISVTKGGDIKTLGENMNYCEDHIEDPWTYLTVENLKRHVRF